MALKVTWTPRAEQGYDKIIKHLEKNWTGREISNFIDETREFLKLLEKIHIYWSLQIYEKMSLEDL